MSPHVENQDERWKFAYPGLPTAELTHRGVILILRGSLSRSPSRTLDLKVRPWLTERTQKTIEDEAAVPLERSLLDDGLELRPVAQTKSKTPRETLVHSKLLWRVQLMER